MGPAAEPREAPHSSCDDDSVIPALGDGRQIRNVSTFAPGVNQLPCNIASDFERLSDGSPLRDKTRQLFRRREEDSFRKFLDLHLNCEFHAT